MNKRNLIILIVVLVALAACVTTIVLVKGNADKKNALKALKADSLARNTVALDSGAIVCDTLGKIDSMTGQVVAVKQQPELDYLVMVNGRKITEAYFNKRVGSLMADAQEAVKKHPKGYLDELVTEELLIAEAERRGLGNRNIQKPNDLFNALEQDVTSSVTVSEAEIQAYYDANKAEMQDMTYEQAKGQIGDFLRKQKLSKVFNDLLSSLTSNADISWNNVWLAGHTADDPLSRALATGRPVVVDFGRLTCAPCLKMAPILEELKKEYAGRVEVVFLNLDDYYALATSVGIQMIPTQIFYDRNGSEVSRHVGAMEKQAIVDLIKKMGVN